MRLFYSGNNKNIYELIKQKNQFKKEIKNLKDEHIIAEFVLEKRDNHDFHLERSLPTDRILTLSCKLCGSNQFTVGQADFFTALKCEQCGYEVGIHEG